MRALRSDPKTSDTTIRFTGRPDPTIHFQQFGDMSTEYALGDTAFGGVGSIADPDPDIAKAVGRDTSHIKLAADHVAGNQLIDPQVELSTFGHENSLLGGGSGLGGNAHVRHAPDFTMRAPHSDPLFSASAGQVNARPDPTIAFVEGVVDVPDTYAGAQALAIGEEAFGTISTPTDEDLYVVQVVNGQTYHINLANDPLFDNALVDPFLDLFVNGGVTPLAQSEDHGLGFNSYISFTANFTGSLFVRATEEFQDATGDYVLSVYQNDIPENNTTPAYLEIGSSVTGFTADFPGVGDFDDDWYQVNLEAGVTYTVNLTGSDSGALSNPFVEIYNSAGGGPLVGDANSVEYTPVSAGIYYISAGGETDNTSGYYDLSITATDVDGWELPNLPEPLASIDWGFTAPSVINVFFAASGVTVVDGESDGANFLTSGWLASEITAAQNAFQSISNVANVTFNFVNTAAAADFVMFESANATTALGYWGVGGSSTLDYGGTILDVDGWGVFNSGGDGWNAAGLAVGGYGFITLIHEIGHGMGLAHPHDDGGSSSIMEGVTGPFDSLGTHQLNQGIWTMMSYNDGWQTGPLGPNSSATNPGFGWEATPMTLDIAVLQDTYGANNTFNSGNTTYTLPSVNAAGSYYRAIWDTGGTADLIRHTGGANSFINLNAAPLSNNASGGGFVSYVVGIHGGFTIANGVVIENASGGGGVDNITGNNAANSLFGNGGGDTLNGGNGSDNLYGGLGSDAHIGGNDAGLDFARYDDANYGNLTIRLDFSAFNAGAAAVGDTYNGIEGLVGGAGIDSVVGNGSANFLYGQGGGDFIYGQGGADSLNGGNGSDNLYGGQGGDSHVGGDDAGIDFARYDDANYGNLTIRLDFSAFNAGAAAVGDTYSGIEGLVGGAGNDTIVGNGSANFLYGQGGNDTLYGQGGADSLNGGNGGDSLYGGQGADSHVGGNDAGIDFARYDDANYGNLTIRLDNSALNAGAAAVGDTYNGIEGLIGGAGIDLVVGNGSSNFLYGQGSNDTLYGQGGNDNLNGGGGADKFVFNTAPNSTTNFDAISDFAHAVDDILLSQSIFAAIGAALSATELRFGAAAVDGNDFLIYNSANGQLRYDADGSNAGASVLFATVTAGTVLDTGDFVMV